QRHLPCADMRSSSLLGETPLIRRRHGAGNEASSAQWETTTPSPLVATRTASAAVIDGPDGARSTAASGGRAPQDALPALGEIDVAFRADGHRRREVATVPIGEVVDRRPSGAVV